MSATFEDLEVLKSAEMIADSLWTRVVRWDEFAKDVIGKQVARSADSIGANIAESFGRFNFGEKLQFLYYARGSLFETKYWLNRIQARGLLSSQETQKYFDELTALARQLNSFASGLRAVRAQNTSQKPAIREPEPEYFTAAPEEFSSPLFSEEDLDFLNK